MTEIYLIRVGPGLMPVNESDAEIVEKWPLGEYIKCKATRPNNPKFHRKLMTLFNYGYQRWEPQEAWFDGHPAAKDYETFRKNITILAGHCKYVVDINGGVHADADSLSFAKMEPETREKLFQKVITILMQREIVKNQSREEIEAAVSQIMEFA